ncbi:LuxR C-terminal-related transcriptional regulator [Arsenophonus sp. PmNCSU2021_1]|uniref:LuxR C-terminal-related transcriptional regulator n=1 Tax=Arsenophonus sp. PmNCSU2021_1 TaxID=3118989 RepID=UPI003FA59FF0
MIFTANNFSYYYPIFPELTSSQLKVFVLYNNILKVDQIALELDISVNTVCEYLKRIKEKYQVNSMVELKLLFHNRMQSYILYKIEKIR